MYIQRDKYERLTSHDHDILPLAWLPVNRHLEVDGTGVLDLLRSLRQRPVLL